MQEALGSQMQNVHTVYSSENSVLDTQRAELTLGDSARRSSSNEYVQLKRLVKQRGLLDQQLAYYTYKMLFTLSLLVIAIAFLFIFDNFWLQPAGAYVPQCQGLAPGRLLVWRTELSDRTSSVPNHAQEQIETGTASRQGLLRETNYRLLRD